MCGTYSDHWTLVVTRQKQSLWDITAITDRHNSVPLLTMSVYIFNIRSHKIYFNRTSQWRGRIAALFLRGPRCKSRAPEQLHSLVYPYFPILSTQLLLLLYIAFGHQHFPPHHFVFHQSSYHSALHRLSYLQLPYTQNKWIKMYVDFCTYWEGHRPFKFYQISAMNH